MSYTKEQYETEKKELHYGLGECGHTGKAAYCGVCYNAQPSEVKRIAGRNRYAYIQAKKAKAETEQERKNDLLEFRAYDQSGE